MPTRSASGGGAGGVTMDNPITKKLATAAALSPEYVEAVLEYHAGNAQNQMRTKAPWTDRTGNARGGLFAQVFKEGLTRGIVLYHTMPYGIWLEVRFSGKYRIIVPTVNTTGKKVMTTLRGLYRGVT